LLEEGEVKGMDLKKKLVLSMATAMLGMSLIAGGTYSYFNDSKETDNTFTTGILDLGINKESIIKMDNLVPGDTINEHFELTNDGTIDIKEVLLHSDYKIMDKRQNNNEDNLADYIQVEFLHHVNENKKVIFSKKLSELKKEPIPILQQFPAGSAKEKFTVRFEFKNSKGSQNHFQGDSLNLKWRLEAIQRDGKPEFINE
jgi:spore coat-associated protein N